MAEVNQPEVDDVYPNSGEYFMPREEPKVEQARQSEEAYSKAAKKFIDRAIKELDKRITFYDTTSSIEVDVTTKTDAFLKQWNINQMTKANLEDFKSWIETNS